MSGVRFRVSGFGFWVPSLRLATTFPFGGTVLLPALHRKSRFGPRVEAAQQSRGVFYTFSFEIDHRTGARVFGRSSAVGDNQLVARHFAGLSQDLIDGDQARTFDMRLLKGHLAAHIDY